jgi:hypothetical protein
MCYSVFVMVVVTTLASIDNAAYNTWRQVMQIGCGQILIMFDKVDCIPNISTFLYLEKQSFNPFITINIIIIIF